MKGDFIPELVPINTIFQGDSAPLKREKIGITVLTGFLGAGKSTLLGRILHESHGMKIAVIMNEIGDSGGVDRAQIFDRTGRAGEEWLEVENGCLCCTAKNETFLAIEGLLLRRPDIKHVVIEASGAADPSVLVKELWIDDALESLVQLDGIVCVVDINSISKLLDPSGKEYALEAARQIAIADLILLNKTDTIPIAPSCSALDSVKVIESATNLLKNINPIARIVATSFSDVPLSQVFNIAEYRDDDKKRLLSQFEQMQLSIGPSHASAGIDRIRSFTVNPKWPCSQNVFERWLFTLLWDRTIQGEEISIEDQILRIKGIIHIKTAVGTVAPFALQVVRDIYDFSQLQPAPPADNMQAHLGSRAAGPAGNSHLIFIGRITPFTEDRIKTSLHEIIVENE